MASAFFRPVLSATARPAAASMPFKSAISRQAIRGYADQASSPSPQSSNNLPLLLGLGGLAGLSGYIYFYGGLSGATKGKVGDVQNAISSQLGVLDKKEFKEFVLKEVRPYNHDSSTFVFELPQNAASGLTVASALLVKGAGEGVKDKDGKDVIRPYTPVTSPDTQGHLDLLIKKYPNGAMTNHIHSLKPGDKLSLKGPIDKYQYKPNTLEHIGMIAGGTGITPMWQVIQAIANDATDKTKVTLIYANKTEKDILLREEFDKLAKNDDRFNVVYGLDKKPKSFGGDHFEGYVTPEHISKHMPAPGKADKIKIFVCGPPPQVEVISGGKGPKGSQGELKGLLADAGYQPDQIYKF